jgi:hypothetical protein
MTTFHEHLKHVATTAITAIHADAAHEIYALSFLIDNEDDDPREPVLTIGYNTETQVALRLHEAADPAEARWNYAFWLQNTLAVIGHRATDPVGASRREEWFKGQGLWYDDPADGTDWIKTVGSRAALIEAHFNQACYQLARGLHETGIIDSSLGRPVPVIVHELEYYEGIARRTEMANPPGLADEFTAWVRS